MGYGVLKIGLRLYEKSRRPTAYHQNFGICYAISVIYHSLKKLKPLHSIWTATTADSYDAVALWYYDAMNERAQTGNPRDIIHFDLPIYMPVTRNGQSQTGKTLLRKLWWKKHWFLARKRGEVSGDRGRPQVRPSSAVIRWSWSWEKKTKLVTGVFGEGERAASKKSALREGLVPQGWYFGVFGPSFR